MGAQIILYWGQIAYTVEALRNYSSSDIHCKAMEATAVIWLTVDHILVLYKFSLLNNKTERHEQINKNMLTS